MPLHLLTPSRTLAKLLLPTLCLTTRSRDWSQYAAFASAGAAASFSALGKLTHNNHLSEAGVLSGEAALNGVIITSALQLAWQERAERKYCGQRIFQGRRLFPLPACCCRLVHRQYGCARMCWSSHQVGCLQETLGRIRLTGPAADIRGISYARRAVRASCSTRRSQIGSEPRSTEEPTRARMNERRRGRFHSWETCKGRVSRC